MKRTNWMIVKNPQSRFLPQRIRAWLGEVYLTVDVFPSFVPDIEAARVFPSMTWAASYLYDRHGKVKEHFIGAVMRPTWRAHTIPRGDDSTAADPGARAGGG